MGIGRGDSIVSRWESIPDALIRALRAAGVVSTRLFT